MLDQKHPFDAQRDESDSQHAADRDCSPEPTIVPGMAVETTSGDELGKHDLTTPRVSEVVRDEHGNPQELIIKKGTIFRKEIDIPVDRIAAIEPPGHADSSGNVIIATQEEEINALKSIGTEELPPKPQTPQPDRRGETEPPEDLISKVEEEVPTAEGERRREERAHWRSERRARRRASAFSLRNLGPGFLAGMAGDDASAVTSYAINGSTNGYGQLWLLLLVTPFLQAVQYTCGKIGRVTQCGLEENIRERFGRKVALPLALLLIISNIALIAADLVAVGVGLQLVTGLAWEWFVAPVAITLWYITLYRNFGFIMKVFTVMSLAFLVYFVTAILSGAHWGDVLLNTFVPHLSLGFASVSSAVALLGATISPYQMVWQARGEKEEQRSGPLKRQIQQGAADVSAGVFGGNGIAYVIIITTSATLFAHHKQIATAADAASALESILGPLGKYLFALGLIGAGLIAIPVLLASTSYSLSGTFGWTASLWRKPWQSEGFYLTLTVALVASLILALVGIQPIQLIFYANILQGVLAPALVILILLIGNSHRLMRAHRISKLTSAWLVLTAAIMLMATVLLFYGLISGQGSL